MKEYIVLVPNNIKNKIIELSRIKYYNYNIKFMSIDTFIKRVTFDYDEKTIYSLMKEYNYNYSTSLVYLDNLNYISNKLSNNKMTKLKEIKDYLDSNKLLIYDNLFKEYVTLSDALTSTGIILCSSLKIKSISILFCLSL